MSIIQYKKLFIQLFREYWIDILLAIIFVIISFKIFAVFLFIEIIIQINKATDYLRKVIRVFQVESDMRIITIVKKLGITADEISDNTEKYYKNLSKTAWKKFIDDYKDVTGLILDREESNLTRKN